MTRFSDEERRKNGIEAFDKKNSLVAYPAKYGNSGVMTFIVNHDGVVYEKDLGKNTGKITKAMKKYEPGPGWKKVEDGMKK